MKSLVNSKACLCEGPGFDSQEYQPVIPAVPYLPTGLAGCSVGPENSRGARKLARTSRARGAGFNLGVELNLTFPTTRNCSSFGENQSIALVTSLITCLHSDLLRITVAVANHDQSRPLLDLVNNNVQRSRKLLIFPTEYPASAFKMT
ncbi:hypothetical protein NC653_020429 [Populus alba x Populus x berolinensis]|uniref:Uncharacterized protein n=1 Tax=Populus alba x Populus x berolinensis TaxID=444605 RepID=A0AAD6ML57_9ROSI|nr:hypothetical protein NC653_020429 [Populus alba x Populus x berolinensis]